MLDINYRHGNEEINLFSVAVNHLLRDYDYTPPGGQAPARRPLRRGQCELRATGLRSRAAEVLLKAVEEWTKLDPARVLRFEPVLKRLRLLRNVVLNPYSHPLAPNIPTTEVQGAIVEVEKLIDAFDGKP